MTGIKFKKLLSKREERSLLEKLIRDLDLDIQIRDKDGELLLGEGTGGSEHEIRYCGELLGHIVGEKGVNSVLSLLEYLIGSEIEKKQLAMETLDRYKEINVLHNLSKKLASTLDTKAVAGTVLYEAMKYIKGDCSSMILLDEETSTPNVISEFTRQPNLKTVVKSSKSVISIDNDIVKQVIFTSKAQIVNDIPSRSEYKNCEDLNSIICSPLTVGARTIGAITLCSKDSIDYEADDLDLLTTFAFQAAIAVESSRLYNSLKDSFYETINTLSETIEKRDPYTAGHAKRVAGYSLEIGRALGLSSLELVQLKLSALLHDIGKIGIRDSILLKDGPLNDIEQEVVKKHTEHGYEILKNVKQLRDILPGVRSHHERFDGFGYPDGLKGEAIPLKARIISIADYFDTITSDRPYRKGYNVDFALEDVKKNKGSLFDPKVVEAFVQAFKDKDIIKV